MVATSSDGRERITGMPFHLLVRWVTGRMGMKPYRAGQIFSWVHQKRVTGFGEMTSISREARERLDENAVITVLRKQDTLIADDGTVKHSYSLDDGETVEAVLIPDGHRLTACLSTQAGCRCGCVFCRTGMGGFRRDLKADEIVAQLYALQKSSHRRISNVVFMGMGEPMDNFRNLKSALSIISDDRGICIGARKITVSTVGIPGGIARLAELESQYGLAVSLHSAVAPTRLFLVPVSKALPLKDLKKDISLYNDRTGRRVTLEYCMISGINDSQEEAAALANFCRGIQCKINLLVYNPVPGIPFESPDAETVERFTDYLYPRCQAVTLRRSRGSDIAAACGQLGGNTAPGVGSE